MVILKGADSGESRRPLGGTTSQGRSCFPDPRAVCQLDIVKRRGYMDSEGLHGFRVTGWGVPQVHVRSKSEIL